MKKQSKKRKNKKSNILYNILSLVTVAFLVFGIYEIITSCNVLHMKEIILNKEYKKQKTYININSEPYAFAEYNKEKFYFARDDKNLYIIKLSNDKYKDISSKIKKNKLVKINGYINPISEDLKESALTAYNEIINNKVVTDKNFSLFFGNVYLEEDNVWTLSYLSFLVGGSLIVVNILFYRKDNYNVKQRNRKKHNKKI